MVVAMVAGMAVLGGALRGVLALADVPYSMDRYPALTSVEMGLTKPVGMAVWMRVRRHGWTSMLEMSLAMLVPAVAVVPLMWLDVLDHMTAMTVEHVAMLLLMLAVMVRRREEYLAHQHSGSGRIARTARRVLPIAGRGLVVLLAFLAIPSAAFVADSRAYEQSRYAQPELTTTTASAVTAATPLAHDPGKPTAVVVVGGSGANVADTLVPYDVLALHRRVQRLHGRARAPSPAAARRAGFGARPQLRAVGATAGRFRPGRHCGTGHAPIRRFRRHGDGVAARHRRRRQAAARRVHRCTVARRSRTPRRPGGDLALVPAPHAAE
jgi:hypothetical protein